MPADEHFRHQGRDGDEDQGDKIQSDDHPPAVLSGEITELPNVGDARLGTDRNDEEENIGGPTAWIDRLFPYVVDRRPRAEMRPRFLTASLTSPNFDRASPTATAILPCSMSGGLPTMRPANSSARP